MPCTVRSAPQVTLCTCEHEPLESPAFPMLCYKNRCNLIYGLLRSDCTSLAEVINTACVVHQARTIPFDWLQLAGRLTRGLHKKPHNLQLSFQPFRIGISHPHRRRSCAPFGVFLRSHTILLKGERLPCMILLEPFFIFSEMQFPSL